MFFLVLLAALLLQTAWILALPAFRGSDEFDHVFKAEAVAHGQLLDEGHPEAGRGGLVEVREDIVTAASAMCASYAYTGPDNCNAVEQRGSGRVTVASAASRYNPAYYAVVGLAARPFQGAAADFAMRAVTAVLAAMLLAWAAVVTSGWSRNKWPLMALLVTATPVLMYSTAVAAPNGVGYAAGCLLWAAGLGLVENPERPHLVALPVAAVTMVATHGTGVMWLAAIVVVIALLQPTRTWARLLRRRPLQLTGAALVTGAGSLVCLAWILLAKTNALEPTTGSYGRIGPGDLATGQLVWTLQTIAAFPLRENTAPMVVYALWLLLFGTLLVTGFRYAGTRLRLVIVLLLLIWLAVPVALTIVSFSSQGLAWQGRYALPLAIGFPALAGLALNRRVQQPRTAEIAVTVTACAVAQVVSCVQVAWFESEKGLAPTFAANVPGGVAIIAVLALTGTLLPLVLTRTPMPDLESLRGQAEDRAITSV